MSRLLTYFARGCLALVPVAATLYITYGVVTTLDRWLGVTTPGLGLALTVVLITLTGLFFSNVIGRQLLWLVDQLLSRMPLVKLIYTSVRDLVNAFGGTQPNLGQAVAFRTSPGGENRQVGFVTRDQLAQLALPDHVCVYVPMAYGIGGQIVLVPRTQLEPLPLSASELLTFVVSGGTSGLRPEKLARPEK